MIWTNLKKCIIFINKTDSIIFDYAVFAVLLLIIGIFFGIILKTIILKWYESSVKMSVQNKEYEKIVRENIEKCKETYKEQTEYILNSTAQYHGRYVRTLCIPKLFDEKQCERLKNIAEYTQNILVKTIKHYKENPEFRKKFMFEPELERLILIDSDLECILPVSRIDIFFNEDNGDFKFCEINTDGTSAMNEDRELNIAVKKTFAYNEFAKNHKLSSFELFDSFVEEFKNIYSGYKFKKENPNVAIVDFLDLGTTNEFEQFKLAFERAGINIEICEIKDLVYKKNALYSKSGMRIDAIYRRAVTCDIMKNTNELSDFIKAIENHSVCLVGPISTQVVHSKVFFEVISDENNLTYLTDEEKSFVKAHFPKTYHLTRDNKLFNLQEVLNNKNKWIIKPIDSYGSKGVFAGVEGDDKDWKDYVLKAIDTGYVLQEFCKPYENLNIDFVKDNPEFLNYSNLSGLFVYNNKFKGVYSRVSANEIISTQYSEIALATVKVL